MKAVVGGGIGERERRRERERERESVAGVSQVPRQDLFGSRNGHTETPQETRIQNNRLQNYKVRHNITTNTNVHLIMGTIKPQLMF